jgi:hypothetical protein
MEKAPRLRIGVYYIVALALATGSIAALLLELYDTLPMETAILVITLPFLLLLAGLTVLRAANLTSIQDRVRVGVIAGLVGTIGYDLIRIPFAYFGMRVFAPISSYGLLGMGAGQSSPLTTTVGWLYHLSNGLTFGIIYALAMARRNRWWGVLFGVGLEAAAFLGPFTDRYGLNGTWFAISVAFLAHIAYGLPLGVVVEKFDRVAAFLKAGRWRTGAAVFVPTLAIILYMQPWSVTADQRLAADLSGASGTPTAVVVGDRWEPEWLRIHPGECVDIVNGRNVSFESDLGTVSASTTTQLCPVDEGAHRVKLDDEPFSGGFIYVDR